MRVLVADPIAQEGIDLLKDFTQTDVKIGMSPDELLAVIGRYEALIVRSETKVTAKVIEAGKILQVIGRAGTGVDNIDVPAATQKGIIVLNVPTGNTMSATEHTMAMMLALARHIPQAHGLLKSGIWKRAEFTGIELRNKVLGVVGLGNIGSEVAKRAKVFQMTVIAYDPLVSPERAGTLGVELVSLETLLKKSDFITLHLPLIPETRGFIGIKELAMVKPGVRIINCARGGLIDEEGLYQAIVDGKVGGAACDVFSVEPANDNILLKSDRVIVTPHLAASTEEAQKGIAIDVAQQIISVLKGEPARYAVNAPLLSPELMAVLGPHIKVSSVLGRMVAQLVEGPVSAVEIKYEGEVSGYKTEALKASVLGGLLQSTSEEKINLVNADTVAAGRGIKITEVKSSVCETYSSLITLKTFTGAGEITVAGTVLRGEPNIVRLNNYWIDIAPAEGYYLFSAHLDRPGLIGAVGNVTGKAGINISSMKVSRLKARGQALMVLGLDDALNEEQLKELLAVPDVYTAKVVKL
ncbi:MAG: phosphoglycerate dehydrogenase [Dehalococcoidia bacterium]|nr:phosphoglycerate dehydrogenase [Dehalococcoidia bacterium]MDZ4247286.1 phosphoglycerate dehydrogenase [Dehalococcoidia bacterium]